MYYLKGPEAALEVDILRPLTAKIKVDIIDISFTSSDERNFNSFEKIRNLSTKRKYRANFSLKNFN